MARRSAADERHNLVLGARVIFRVGWLVALAVWTWAWINGNPAGSAPVVAAVFFAADLLLEALGCTSGTEEVATMRDPDPDRERELRARIEAGTATDADRREHMELIQATYLGLCRDHRRALEVAVAQGNRAAVQSRLSKCEALLEVSRQSEEEGETAPPDVARAVESLQAAVEAARAELTDGARRV